MIEIIQAETDSFNLFLEDLGEQSAAENAESRGQIIAGLIEEDEVAESLAPRERLVDLGFKSFGSELYFGPAAVIWFVIPKNQEYNAKGFDLVAEKVEEALVLDVANVPDQCEVWCFGSDVEDVICCWGFQMEIGDDLELRLGHWGSYPARMVSRLVVGGWWWVVAGSRHADKHQLIALVK